MFLDERDLYDDADRLIETDQVNAQRDLWELRALAELAREERESLGGDMERLWWLWPTARCCCGCRSA